MSVPHGKKGKSNPPKIGVEILTDKTIAVPQVLG